MYTRCDWKYLRQESTARYKDMSFPAYVKMKACFILEMFYKYHHGMFFYWRVTIWQVETCFRVSMDENATKICVKCFKTGKSAMHTCEPIENTIRR